MENNESSSADNVDEFVMRKRLTEISDALRRLEKRSQRYLDLFTKTEDWRMFKDGFLALNYYFRPEDLVEIKTCDLGTPVNSSLVPSQQKIVICSNKIKDQEDFNTAMTYNLTLLYDQLRANIDSTDCKQLACINIRAGHLSKICKGGDKECFKKLLRANVYSKEICKGKEDDTFDLAYRSCIRDISPINVMKMTGKLNQ